MPWWKSKDDSWPSHYVWPSPLCDDTVTGKRLGIAVGERKQLMQAREGLLAAQKQVGRENRLQAKELGQYAADLLKRYRGYDAAIKLLQCAEFTKWPRSMIQEEIAPYVDAALMHMEYGESK
jgi:hypothetical protein